MENYENNQERFYFGITPEYFTRMNLSPEEPLLYAYCFSDYEKYNEYIPKKLEENYKKLDKKYLEKLPFDYKEKVKKVKEGMKINQEFFSKVSSLYINDLNYIQLTNEDISKFEDEEMPFLSKYFLEILTREWAEEGKEERSKTITPIIQELKKYYNYENKALMEKGVNVLVIGSHFMRVPFELAKLGYYVEANEKNYSYLLVANYLFNYSKKNESLICPRISSFCSSFTEESVTKKHSIPDVDIWEELKNIDNDGLTVYKGDFEYDYGETKEYFDCVITNFSTELAQNIISFTEMVNHVLKKGGIWINLGGLNNVYSEYGGFDLTWDEWKHVILNSGFEMKREETPVLPYCQIKGHSLPYTVGTVFFTVQKK